MRAFSYSRAASLPDALAAVGAGAVPVAGTTEAINWLRLGILDAEAAVDLSDLDELRGLRVEDGGLWLGALTTLAQVGASDAVTERAPVLASACLQAASPQLRHRATLCGNVLQRTRCPFFRVEAATPSRLPWPCNKRDAGSGCAALESLEAPKALFGWTEACVAVQPSDPIVALAALDAEVELISTSGRRTLPVVDLLTTPAEVAAEGGDVAAQATTESRLRPGELILGYRVPGDAAARRSAYVKIRDRASYAYALVSAAACLEVEDERVVECRIALGSVALKPWRLPDAEAALRGRAPTRAHFLAALDASFELDASLEAARPRSDRGVAPGHDVHWTLTRNAALRALETARDAEIHPGDLR